MEQRAGERPAGRGQLLGKKIIHIRDTWRVGGGGEAGESFQGRWPFFLEEGLRGPKEQRLAGEASAAKQPCCEEPSPAGGSHLGTIHSRAGLPVTVTCSSGARGEAAKFIPPEGQFRGGPRAEGEVPGGRGSRGGRNHRKGERCRGDPVEGGESFARDRVVPPLKTPPLQSLPPAGPSLAPRPYPSPPRAAGASPWPPFPASPSSCPTNLKRLTN